MKSIKKCIPVFKLLLAGSICLGMSNCRSSRNTSGDKDPVKIENSDSTAAQPMPKEKPSSDQQQEGPKYSLVLTFTSQASGINHDAHRAFVEFMKSYPSVSPEKYQWGREGEVDYCMDLTKMSQTEQKDFISSLKGKMEGHSRVFFEENAACRHKR